MAVSAPQVSFDHNFFSSAQKLGNEAWRVFRTIDQFSANPNHPGLNLEPVEPARPHRLHTIRVSQEIRILLAKEGNVYHLIKAGHHKDVDLSIRRKVFVINPNRRFIGLVTMPAGDGSGNEDPDGDEDDGMTSTPAIHAGPAVFDHWADDDLARAGFSDLEIAELRKARTEEEFYKVELDQKVLLRAMDLIEITPEQWRAPTLDERPGGAETRLSQAITEFGALNGISPLFPPEEVARIAAAPIEDWMIFLHPDQRAVVERRYEGPARVRGAAGTGKTVVALHRAAALARRFQDEEAPTSVRKILFTTYIRTLPPVFEQLYRRLPNSVEGVVHFTNVDRLAWRIAAEAGKQIVVEPRGVEAAFASAWRRAVAPRSALQQAHLSRNYLREEISAVIKGRGVRTLDEYLTVERTGRRTRFPQDLRRQTWDLMVAWQEEMGTRGTLDYPDVVLIAREEALKRPEPTYRAAVIDEAQDITLVGLQFVRALVNGQGGDRPDGLFFVGDGAQRIYAGGFTLHQAGVEVHGRTTLLRANYRNTAEILAAAMAVAGDEAVEDLGDTFRRRDDGAGSERGGKRPALVSCADRDAETVFLVSRIEAITAETSVGFGDIGVFAPTNNAVEEHLGHLAEAGIPCQGLDKYDGRQTPRVKVGTYHRAKGLEFKVVFLPGLNAGEFPRPQNADQDSAEYDETRSLAVSQLFVAMTRARDQLYLLCSGDPSEILAGGLDSFDVIDFRVKPEES